MLTYGCIRNCKLCMAKVDYRELTSKERQAALDSLAEMIVLLKDKKQAREFIDRLLTPSEVVMLARRIGIANLLVHGASYVTIQEKLKVGVSTIRTVDQWLDHAIRDYHTIRAEHKAKQRLERKRVRPRREPRGVGTIGYAYSFPFEKLFDLFIE